MICVLTYQIPNTKSSKKGKFVKSVRIRIPTAVESRDFSMISAKLNKMEPGRKNRSVANVGEIKIDAKVVKNSKFDRRTKHTKSKRLNIIDSLNELEYFRLLLSLLKYKILLKFLRKSFKWENIFTPIFSSIFSGLETTLFYTERFAFLHQF